MSLSSQSDLAFNDNTDITTTHRESVASVAEARLRNSSYATLRNIACEWRQGVLTLRGCVSSYHLKQLAQALLQGVQDVLCVDNQLEVVSPPGARHTHREASHAAGQPSRRPR
jgi:osmotically-inducible protein OsmY